MSDESRKSADAQFRKVQRAEEGKRAMLEYEAAAAAVEEKTARLRAARLAKEAAEAAETAAVPAKSTKSKKPKEPGAKLADWLRDRQRSGRRS